MISAYIVIFVIIAGIISLYNSLMIKGTKTTRIILILIATILIGLFAVGAFFFGMNFGQSYFSRIIHPPLVKMVNQLDSWCNTKEYDMISQTIANLKTDLSRYGRRTGSYYFNLFEMSIKKNINSKE